MITATIRIIRHWSLLDFEIECRSDSAHKISHRITLSTDTEATQIVNEDFAQLAIPAIIDLPRRATESIRRLLGAEIVSFLTSLPCTTLRVVAETRGHALFALPFEALIDGLTVVRVVVASSRARPPAQAGSNSRLVSSFSLLPDDAYLPLHKEASRLASFTDRHGFIYVEHFICFDRDNFLESGVGAAIVHLAGHGSGSAMRFPPNKDHTRPSIDASSMITAWRDHAPTLIILNFCESSNARDVLDAAVAEAMGSIESDRRYIFPNSRSSSMALDLAASLPTTVIAFRHPVEDLKARNFVEAFYDECYLCDFDIAKALDRAVIRTDFYDLRGVPVPVLYTNSLAELARPNLSNGQIPSANYRSDEERLLINLYYNVFGSPDRLLHGSWCFQLVGGDQSIGAKVEALARDLIHLSSSQHQHPAHEPGGRSVEDRVGNCLTLGYIRDGDHDVALYILLLDGVPDSAAIGEINDRALHLDHTSRRLLYESTGSMTTIVTALAHIDLDSLVSDLHRLDSTLPSFHPSRRIAMANVVLAHLPEVQHRAMRSWLASRWTALQDLGETAIDLVAARLFLKPGQHFSNHFDRLWSYYSERSGKATELIFQTVDRLAQANVIEISPEIYETSICPVNVDLFTAARAGAVCSAAAQNAYMKASVDEWFEELYSNDSLEWVADESLLELGLRCIECGDARSRTIFDELIRRGRVDTAALLTDRAPGLSGTTVQPPRPPDDTTLGLDDDEQDVENDIETRIQIVLGDAYTLMEIANATIDGQNSDIQIARLTAMLARLQNDYSPLQERAHPRVGAYVLLAMTIARVAAAWSKGEDQKAAQIVAEVAPNLIGPPLQPSHRLTFLRTAVQACLQIGHVSVARAMVDGTRLALPPEIPPHLSIAADALDAKVAGFEERTGYAIDQAESVLSRLQVWPEDQTAVYGAIFGDIRATFELVGASEAEFTVRVAQSILINGTASIDDIHLGARSPIVGNVEANTTLDLTTVRNIADHIYGHLSAVLADRAVSGGMFREMTTDATERANHLARSTIDAPFARQSAIAALSDRARRGCPLAEVLGQALSVTGSRKSEARERANQANWSDISTAGLSVEQIFSFRLQERMESGLYHFAKAHSGDREARLVVFARILGDRQRSNGFGEVWAGLATGTPLHEILDIMPTEPFIQVLQACVVIDKCARSVNEVDLLKTSTSEQFAEISMQAWSQILKSAFHNREQRGLIATCLRDAAGNDWLLEQLASWTLDGATASGTDTFHQLMSELSPQDRLQNSVAILVGCLQLDFGPAYGALADRLRASTDPVTAAEMTIATLEVYERLQLSPTALTRDFHQLLARLPKESELYFRCADALIWLARRTGSTGDASKGAHAIINCGQEVSTTDWLRLARLYLHHEVIAGSPESAINAIRTIGSETDLISMAFLLPEDAIALPAERARAIALEVQCLILPNEGAYPVDLYEPASRLKTAPLETAELELAALMRSVVQLRHGSSQR